MINGCVGKLNPNEKEANYNTIIKNLTNTFDSAEFIDPTEIYMTVVGELSNIPYYDWVGIYLLDSDTISYRGIVALKVKGSKKSFTSLSSTRSISSNVLPF